MTVAQFVDVSGFQSSIDFHAYAAWSKQGDGVSRIAIKATEGIGFVDPLFESHRTGALATGVDSILYYGFGRPDLGNNAIAESDFLHSVVGALRANDVIVLDLEVNHPLATASWAYEWLARQEQNYGKIPVIYASDAYIRQRLQDSRLVRYYLWLANWTFNPDARPPCPPPWQTYAYLQFTDRAEGIPGIAGTVDANISLLSPPKKEDDIMDTSDPFFQSYFTDKGNGVYQCKTNGLTMLGAIAQYWLLCNGSPRLPLSGELYSVFTQPDVVAQIFESCIIIYDPGLKHDHPDVRHSCYLLKASDPSFKPLMRQYGGMPADAPTNAGVADAITALQAQGSTITLLTQGLEAAQAANQHALSSLGGK